MSAPTEYDDRIIGAALKILRQTLTENYDFEWGDKFGKPPRSGFVMLREFKKREQPYSVEPALRKWSISIDGVEEIAADFEPPKNGRIEGMFYDSFLGWFEIRPDQKGFEIGWQTGPRFGRGYSYDIELYPESGYRLSEPRAKWAS